METDMLHSAAHALLIILDPTRLMYLFAGVCMGLSLGILPGIGGIAGTALLLPFTYNLDPPTAFALLLGLGATTTTADPIAAILFGAPGHAASAATTLDGYPMTRRGEAGRALGVRDTFGLSARSEMEHGRIAFPPGRKDPLPPIREEVNWDVKALEFCVEEPAFSIR